jgi:hypothetical protein
MTGIRDEIDDRRWGWKIGISFIDFIFWVTPMSKIAFSGLSALD